MPNDTRLAESVDGIDIILGGHDHHYEVKKVCISTMYVIHAHLVHDCFRSFNLYCEKRFEFSC